MEFYICSRYCLKAEMSVCYFISFKELSFIRYITYSDTQLSLLCLLSYI